jgi:hypothetical protein
MPSAIQVWSCVGYLLSSPTFAATDMAENALYERCLSTLQSCHDLCKLAGDTIQLAKSVPAKVAQSNSWVRLMEKFESDSANSSCKLKKSK